MKLLIVGSSGQVGRALARQALGRGDSVDGTFLGSRPTLSGVSIHPLDKTDPVACRALLGRVRPDAVVDAAALHNVDRCETNPLEADRVNRDGTTCLAEASRDVSARYLFISTDFVFDGTGHPPYTEDDPPHPASAYGRSKLAGEQTTLALSPVNVVVRPSVIYSWVAPQDRAESSTGKGLNFGTWLVEEVRQGRPVRIVNDQRASPTLASDLGEAILDLLARDARGLFHAAGTTVLSRYEFARRLVGRVGLDPALVSPVATAALGQKALRPSDSSLNSERLAQTLGHPMLDLERALDRFAKAYGETGRDAP